MAGNPYDAPLQTEQPSPAGFTRTLHIKEIDVMSFGILNGAFGVCLGLAMGVVVAAVSFLSTMLGGDATAGLVFGIAVIVLAPAVYGIGAFLGGCLGGLMYNFVAGMVGGVRIRVEV